MRRRARAPWQGNARGAAAVEFTLLVPAFLTILFASLGAGLDGLYQLGLDDSVRNAARQLQIGGPASRSGAAFATAVCKEFGMLATSCAANLTYDVQANTSPAKFASLTPVALPPSGLLSNAFPANVPGSSNLLVQVACPLPFVLPFIGKAITFTGTNSILATTTVRMEPN